MVKYKLHAETDRQKQHYPTRETVALCKHLHVQHPHTKLTNGEV